MYLLDSDILFELRLARSGAGEAGLAEWAREVPRDRLFLSAISLIDLEAAAARTAQRDKAGAAAIRGWINERVLPAFEGNILPLDTAVARRRAQVTLSDSRCGLIAATALEHGLTLVTRATASYKGAKVKLFDPQGYRADDPGEDGDWQTAGRGGAVWLRSLFVRS